jgi:tripartite-type tricarboxylate transporter receptor subunit TctC
MRSKHPIFRTALAAAALALGAACWTVPAMAADFYAGKTIEFLVGGDAGGGYDIYARAIARHIHRYIPGEPTMVVKNLPGAGSGRAAAYLFSVAPKDGTSIGTVFPGVIVGPLLEDRAQALYEPTKFNYLGSADSGTRVCLTFQTSKIKTFEDAQKEKTLLGASQAGGSTRDYANMHNKTAGTKFEVITGYKGTAEIFLAIERGEVDGMCGIDWASLRSQRSDWIRDKKVNILVQANLEPEPELSKMGVPQLWKYIKSDLDKKAVELVVGQQVFGRPYLAPPDVPADRVKVLRDAFTATMQDKAFLADAEKSHIDVIPSSGEKVQQLVDKLYATSNEVVDRAKDIIKP